MGRHIGSENKEKIQPIFQLDEEARVQLIANLIVDILEQEEPVVETSEELCKIV